MSIGDYVTKARYDLYSGYEIHSWKLFPRMIKEDIGSGLDIDFGDVVADDETMREQLIPILKPHLQKAQKYKKFADDTAIAFDDTVVHGMDYKAGYYDGAMDVIDALKKKYEITDEALAEDNK